MARRAIAALEPCAATDSPRPGDLWLLVLACQKAGEKEKAKGALEKATKCKERTGTTWQERQASTLWLGSFTDSDPTDGPWKVVVNWGDGSPNSTFTRSTTGSLGTLGHTYLSTGHGVPGLPDFMREPGIVHRPTFKLISLQVACSTSLVRVAVRMQSSSALAATPSRWRSSPMNAGRSPCCSKTSLNASGLKRR